MTILIFNRTLPISTNGDLHDQALTLANQAMWHFSQGPSNLHLGSESGNLGPLFIANSSSGSRSRIAAGWLQSKGFHPSCDQADETIQHILIGCVQCYQDGWSSLVAWGPSRTISRRPGRLIDPRRVPWSSRSSPTYGD